MTHSEPSLTAFVQKAMDALKEYERLRAEGMSHGQAIYLSGFYNAFVKPDPDRLARDIKALAARNDE